MPGCQWLQRQLVHLGLSQSYQHPGKTMGRMSVHKARLNQYKLCQKIHSLNIDYIDYIQLFTAVPCFHSETNQTRFTYRTFQHTAEFPTLSFKNKEKSHNFCYTESFKSNKLSVNLGCIFCFQQLLLLQKQKFSVTHFYRIYGARSSHMLNYTGNT